MASQLYTPVSNRYQRQLEEALLAIDILNPFDEPIPSELRLPRLPPPAGHCAFLLDRCLDDR